MKFVGRVVLVCIPGNGGNNNNPNNTQVKSGNAFRTGPEDMTSVMPDRANYVFQQFLFTTHYR